MSPDRLKGSTRMNNLGSDTMTRQRLTSLRRPELCVSSPKLQEGYENSRNSMRAISEERMLS